VASRLRHPHHPPPAGEIGVNFPIHSIRHGTATELLDGGFALGVASERLGHDNQTTTARIYAHALPARDREAAEYLAGRLECYISRAVSRASIASLSSGSSMGSRPSRMSEIDSGAHRSTLQTPMSVSGR
jgi:hypothetical protein